MKAVQRFLGWRLSSDTFDARFGMCACFLAGLAVLGMGFRKISTLPLTETELFFATLLVLAVALQAICLGLLVSKAGQPKT